MWLGNRKNQRIFILLGLIFALLIANGCGLKPVEYPKEYTRTVVGFDNVAVKIPDHPKRIITLTSAYDTVLMGLIDPSRMAAISSLIKYEDYSLEWRQAKKVKTQLYSYSFEKIVKLEPDLVIAPEYTSLDTIESLRSMGIPTVVVKSGNTVEETMQNIQTLADLVGESEKGAYYNQNIRAELQWMAEEVAKIPQDQRRSVLFVSSMDGYTGTGSFFDDMTRYMGIYNAPSQRGYPPRISFTDERVLDMNPDYLLIPEYQSMDQALMERFLHTPAFQSMKAMRNHHVMPVKAAYLYTSNQHIGKAMIEIMKIVYPEYINDNTIPLDIKNRLKS